MSTASSNPTLSGSSSSHPNSSGATGPNRFRGDVPSFSPSGQATPSPRINQQPMHMAQAYMQSFYPPPNAPAPNPFVYSNLGYYTMVPQAQFDYSLYQQYPYYPVPTNQFNPQQQFIPNHHVNGYNNNMNHRPKLNHKHKNGMVNGNNNKSPRFANQNYQPPQLHPSHQYSPQMNQLPVPQSPYSSHPPPPLPQHQYSPTPSSGYSSPKTDTASIKSNNNNHVSRSVKSTNQSNDNNNDNNDDNDNKSISNSNNNGSNNDNDDDSHDKITKSKTPNTPSLHSPNPQNSTETRNEESNKLVIEQPTKSNIKKAPLFFNSNLNDFKESQNKIFDERIESFKSKNEKLKAFSKEHESDYNILIHNIHTKIIDHNSDSESFKNTPLIFNNKDTSKSSGHLNKSISDASNKPMTTNWASVLQSSAPKKPTSNTKPKSISGASHQRQSSIDHVSSSATPTRTIDNESAQPLGILILKIMFDPVYANLNNYSAFKVKPRGLTNTGNICYMNAVLQVLLYCEPLNKILKLIDEKAIGSLNQNSSTPLLDLTLKFFKDFLSDDKTSSGSKSLSPEGFYMSLITHDKFQHLKWGQQEDAEEFLGYFLDGLHEEFVSSINSLTTSQIDSFINNYQSIITDGLAYNEFKAHVKNAIKIIKKSNTEKHADSNKEIKEEISDDENDDGWSEVGTGNKKISAKRTVEIEPSPISNIFGGQFRSVLSIPKSKESQSITLDPFQCVQLDISDSNINTVEEAFLKLNEPESIPYKSSHNKEVIARKQTFFDQMPQVLIIHLKRFSYQQETKENKDETKSLGGFGSIEKLRKKITYAHNLSIPQECYSSIIQKSNPDNVGKHYKLTGVIYHHGTGTDGGHYTCDVLRKSSIFDSSDESGGKVNDNEWIRIDDTSISFLDKNDVLDGGVEESTKTAYILVYQKL